jgi:hypothetical protein
VNSVTRWTPLQFPGLQAAAADVGRARAATFGRGDPRPQAGGGLTRGKLWKHKDSSAPESARRRVSGSTELRCRRAEENLPGRRPAPEEAMWDEIGQLYAYHGEVPAEVRRRRRPHPPGSRGTRAGHGQGHARRRTVDNEWSCDRPPLRRSASVRPGRAPPEPRDRRKYAEKQPPAPNRSPGPPAKSQPADAKCRTPASDLLDVLQAVPARRHRSGTHLPASTRPCKRPAGKQPAADRLASATGGGGPRAAASALRPLRPNTAAAAGQPTPPAAPPDGIARPGPGPHCSN